METVIRIKKCPVCKCPTTVRTTREIHYKNYMSQVKECANCHLEYLTLWPGGLYEKSYFDCQHNLRGYDERKTKFYSYYLQKIKKIKPTGTILDIGSGDGHLLLEARRLGYEVYANELEKSQAEILEDKGLPTFQGDIRKKKISKKFDVVVMSHLIEHLIDVGDFMKSVYSLLKDDGILLINTPNHDNFFERLTRIPLFREITLRKDPYIRYIFKNPPTLFPKRTDKEGLYRYKICVFQHTLFFKRKTLDLLMDICGFRPYAQYIGNHFGADMHYDPQGIQAKLIHLLKATMKNKITHNISYLFGEQDEICVVYKKRLSGS